MAQTTFISAATLAKKINEALQGKGYKFDECRAVVASDDRIILRGKKASGEISRATNSLDPWAATDIRHSLIIRILETIPEVDSVNGYQSSKNRQ